MVRTIGLVMLASLYMGCGGGSTGDTTDARPLIDAGPGDFRPDFAGQVRVMEGSGGTAQEFFALRAWITDKGLLPPGQLVAQDGECAVYVHPNPGTCTDCLGYCNADNQCESWPTPQSAGVITVTGLKEPLQFTPQASGYDTPFVGGELFDEGDPITISAPGADIAGFDVQLSGLAPLVVDQTFVSFDSGEAQTITWTPANSGRIQLALIVGHHLAPYEALVLCEGQDDGELTITSELIAQVPRQTSFLEPHASTMARFNRQIVDSAVGAIEVIVGHQIGFGFSYFPE